MRRLSAWRQRRDIARAVDEDDDDDGDVDDVDSSTDALPTPLLHSLIVLSLPLARPHSV